MGRMDLLPSILDGEFLFSYSLPLACIMSSLVNWALAEPLRLREAPLVLGATSQAAKSVTLLLWFLGNPLCDVLCNGQWLPS